MKKLINNPEDVVVEALKGIESAHPDRVKVHYEPNFIYRADAPVQGKVAIVSGGGSGHEPMHGGSVGMGMLDAPAQERCLPARPPTRCWKRRKWFMAAQGCSISSRTTRATSSTSIWLPTWRAPGIEVESVVTNDDVAVQDSLYTAGAAASA